jgi:hypothetical protein
MTIDPRLASKLASLALAHVRREYPNKLDHLMNGPDDVRSPRALHPVFYGSFDWHSNVHGCWLLGTLLRRVPDLPQATQIRSLFDEQLVAEKVAVEVEYLRAPNRAAFERPYGWAWLLMLHAELSRHGAGGISWQRALAPLTNALRDSLATYLPKLSYPIRVGTHFNSAFAIVLAMEYATTTGDDALRALLSERATTWFAGDRGCQAWEPSGDDFLSSALIEAECMRRILGERAWRVWFNRFLPDLELREPRTLFEPVSVSDRGDGKIAHLDGLNLSRAWCWRAIASSLPADDSRRPALLDAAQRHLDAGLPHVAGDYAGEHWLATFALLAVTADEPSESEPVSAGR